MSGRILKWHQTRFNDYYYFAVGAIFSIIYFVINYHCVLACILAASVSCAHLIFAHFAPEQTLIEGANSLYAPVCVCVCLFMLRSWTCVMSTVRTRLVCVWHRHLHNYRVYLHSYVLPRATKPCLFACFHRQAHTHIRHTHVSSSYKLAGRAHWGCAFYGANAMHPTRLARAACVLERCMGQVNIMPPHHN